MPGDTTACLWHATSAFFGAPIFWKVFSRPIRPAHRNHSSLQVSPLAWVDYRTRSLAKPWVGRIGLAGIGNDDIDNLLYTCMLRTMIMIVWALWLATRVSCHAVVFSVAPQRQRWKKFSSKPHSQPQSTSTGPKLPEHFPPRSCNASSSDTGRTWRHP